MNARDATILILGAQSARQRPSENTFGPNRVEVETIKANLQEVMQSVSALVHATQAAASNLNVAHVDVQLAIAADGSVGLIGAGANAAPDATLKVRLQFGRTLKF